MSLQVQDTVPQAAHSSAFSSQSYDLIVVGFGTTALSIATALADNESDLNVLFLESQPTFSWKPASVLPENPLRTSFLRDLITTRNPRSEFTFINYLFETNQLVQFTNLSQMAPSRLVMGNYLFWVAGRMAERGWVRYSSTVTRVTPVKNSTSQIGSWNVSVRDGSGNTSTVSSKRIVLATESRPRIPAALAAAKDKVLHTSQVASLLHNLKDQDIAIVGVDQEAAEIFQHLQTARALHRARATMFIPDSALRPENNTPFTQDIVDGRLPGISCSSIPSELRLRFLSTDMPSAYPKIALHTIEALYDNMYAQRITSSNPADWRFHLTPLSEVTNVQHEPTTNKVRLVTRNTRTGEEKLSPSAFDIVVAAGGYIHSTPLLSDVEDSGLLQDKNLTVDAEYRVSFRREAVANDAGLWVLGSLEENLIRDDAFTFAAERGERLARSVEAVVAKVAKESRSLAML